MYWPVTVDEYATPSRRGWWPTSNLQDGIPPVIGATGCTHWRGAESAAEGAPAM